jgi:hypothetical protein
MSLGGIVARGRAAAERLMVDTCTIVRVTGQTTNPTTGVVTDTTTAVYTGKCKVQVRDVDAQNPEAGDRAYTVLKLRVDLPADTTGVDTGDIVTITAAPYDAELVDRTFRVVAPFFGSQKTARRVPVEEAS